MKILICGLGSIGQRHARNLVKLGYSDIYGLRVRNFGLPNDLKFIKQVSNLKDAVRIAPDVVFITNPTSLHLTYALEFASIGSDLFIEKPLSNSLGKIDRLASLVKKKKLTAMVGYNFRFHPQLIQIKKLIDRNEIGKVCTVLIETGEYLPNWHPKEDYRQGYSARSDLGGGVILTQSHDLDYLYWLFGNVKDVYASAKQISNLEIDVEDTADLALKLKNGVFAFLHLDYLQNPPIRQMTIIGTKGRIFWNYHGNYFEITKNGKTKHFIGDKAFNRNDMFIDELKHFLICVRKRQKPITSIEQGKIIIEIYLAAKESAFTNKKITLD